MGPNEVCVCVYVLYLLPIFACLPPYQSTVMYKTSESQKQTRCAIAISLYSRKPNLNPHN